MKTEDFERLRKLCDDNGFELVTESPNDNDKFFVVKKKDGWEGVEFVQLIEDSGQFKSGKIFKVLDTHKSTFCRKDTYFKVLDLDKEGIWIIKHLFKPSTEQAYVEQLKNECFESFGEIKEGDGFQMPNDGIDTHSISYNEFKYIRESDSFYLGYVKLYQQGKWAKKLPKRIEVELNVSSQNLNGKDAEFKFDLSNEKQIDLIEAGQFLASQLEKYLNGEIE